MSAVRARLSPLLDVRTGLAEALGEARDGREGGALARAQAREQLRAPESSSPAGAAAAAASPSPRDLPAGAARSASSSSRFYMDPAEKGREIKAAEERRVGQQSVVQQWVELQRMRSKANGRLRLLAEKAAAGVRQREITLADGSNATVMPAFVMDYIWTRTAEIGAGAGAGAGAAASPAGGGAHVLPESSAPPLAGDADAQAQQQQQQPSPAAPPAPSTAAPLPDGGGSAASHAPGRGVRYVSYLFANPRLAEVPSARAVLSAQQAPPPMVLVPNPWKDFKRGPYFRSFVPMVRTEPEHRRLLGRLILEERMLLRRAKGERPLDARGEPAKLK